MSTDNKWLTSVFSFLTRHKRNTFTRYIAGVEALIEYYDYGSGDVIDSVVVMTCPTKSVGGGYSVTTTDNEELRKTHFTNKARECACVHSWYLDNKVIIGWWLLS